MFIFPIILLLTICQIEAQINGCGPCCLGCKTCADPTCQMFCPLYIIDCLCGGGSAINEHNNNTCVAVNSLECRAQRCYTYVQLPPACGQNEKFVYCGVCRSTCTHPNICGCCVCLDGYLRDRYGNCIRANSAKCLIENINAGGPILPVV